MKQDSGSQHTEEPGRGELLVLRARPDGGQKRLWKVGRSRRRVTAEGSQLCRAMWEQGVQEKPSTSVGARPGDLDGLHIKQVAEALWQPFPGVLASLSRLRAPGPRGPSSEWGQL